MATTLSGRYRLDERIGGGGMGDVWRARDSVLERDVAVKIIRSDLADSETVRSRLRVEARLAGSLHHPGIVDVFDYGEHQAGSRTVPYVVMPLIAGAPLSRVLNASGAMTPGQAMAIVAGVAEALHASHRAGIVHHDLKPGNILLTTNGRVMLVDFGIARAADGEPLTETGALLGTVSYLSPEQCAGQPATPASDLYGLGVIAFACLTGTLPFHRERDIATALAHIQDPLPPLPSGIPEPVRDLVIRMLAKDPGHRPTSDEVATLAQPCATSPPPLPETARVPQPAAGPLNDLLGVAEIAGTTRARRPRRMAVMGVGALAVAGVAFTVLSNPAPDVVEVPSVRGDRVAAASAELGGDGLRVRTRDVDVGNHEAGEVVGQSPAAGTKVDPGSVVMISVATGRVRIPTDDLLGAAYAAAAARLKSLGLVPRRVVTTSTKPAGTVIAVDPSSRVTSGATVELSVAEAPVAAATSSESGAQGTSTGTSKKKGKSSGKKKGRGKKGR